MVLAVNGGHAFSAGLPYCPSRTQSCESSKIVIKLRTTGMQMSELVGYMNMQFAEHRKFEMSQTVQSRSGHAFQRVPVVYRTGLLKCILDTNISAYASALLAVEFSKAEGLCFSADLPPTVEIKDDMSDEKHCSQMALLSTRSRVRHQSEKHLAREQEIISSCVQTTLTMCMIVVNATFCIARSFHVAMCSRWDSLSSETNVK